MKQRPLVKPYMGSADININASISMAKLFKRIRTVTPTYKPSSRYQMRLKHKRATRRLARHIVR